MRTTKHLYKDNLTDRLYRCNEHLNLDPPNYQIFNSISENV